MTKKNDWVATMLFNQPSSMEEVIANGVTPENTGIQSKEYYKNIDAIQETFTGDDGKFNEVAFDNFYNSSLEMYNQFAQEEWTKKLVKDMDRDPFDWTNPLNTNVKDISATVKNGYNPERRSMSIAGIGNIGDPTFSIREIAQDNEVRDEAGNKLGWTPNQKGVMSIFEPTVALATWDEDGTHLVNGVETIHKKGDFKTDENGDFFYEVLGKREAYDKEILRVTDVLTTDGSTLNKFDFLDSDGITKSVGSVVGKTAMQIVPLLIPGVGQVYGTLSALTTFASVLPTLGKAINGIIGNNNSELGQGLTQMENWFTQFKPTTSDKGKQSFFSLENIGEILTSSAKQLYQQKSLANLAKLVNKNDALRASNLGQKISLSYLALTSSQETYADFRKAGASEEMAGIGMLASTAALYGLMNTDYFRDALFKGTFMDESEAMGIIKNYNDDVISKIHTQIAKSPNTDEALSMYEQIRKGLSDKLTKFLDSPFSGKAQGAQKAWNTGLRVINRSVNEGVEETMEEVVFDAVKAISAGLNALGVPVSEEGRSLDFGFTLEDTLLRYASSFVGGALGGAVFEGINTWEKFLGPKVVELSDKTSLEQMEYFIITGRTNELLDRAKVLYDKGRLGNKNLSATKTYKNSKGETFYAEGTETDNQNLASYNAIVNQINYVDAILKKHNIHLMMDGFGENPTPNETFIKASQDQNQKQKELGIKSDEYTFNFKTNALIETFNTYKFGSSYVNEIVSLGDQIVKAESKLNKLTAKKKDSEADVSKTEEIKYWENKLKDLLKQRDDLMNGVNTDKYVHEVLFMTSPTLRGSFMADDVIERGDVSIEELTKGAYWSNSVEGYVKSLYHKNFHELPEYEQKIFQKEFDDYKKAKGNDQLRLAASLHYDFIEKLNPNIIEIEEASKDKTLDNYHKHGVLNSMEDSDFSRYELLSDTLGIAKLGLAEMNKAFSDYVNTWDPEKGNILEDEQYKQFEAELLRQESEIESLEYELTRYKALYGENADTQESITEIGKTNLYDGFVDNVLSVEESEQQLRNFSEIIALEQDIENLNQVIMSEEELNETIQALREEELADPSFDAQSAINELIDSNNDNIKQVEAKQRTIDAIRPSLEGKTVDDINNDIVQYFKNIMDDITKYYEHLRDNNLVSENHFALKRGLDIIATKIAQKLKNERIDIDAVGEIEDENFYKKLTEIITNRVSNYFNLLKVGNISEAVAAYKVLVSDVSELFKEVGTGEDAEAYVKNIMLNSSYGLDIRAFINDINEIVSELNTFSILGFLNNTEINVGKHVYQTIDLLEKEEKTFIGSTDLIRYIINDGVKLNALKQIPRVLLLGYSLFQNAYSGINRVLNVYRKEAGKELLIDTISESTKDVVASHIDYLWQKAATLLTKHKINLERKSEFHKVSEVKIKMDFVKNLLFKKDEDDSFIKRLQTKFFGDDPKAFNVVSAIEDLMRKHGIVEDTAVTDFKTYNTFFVELCDLLYNSVHAEFGENADLEVGKRLAKLLPNDAYKLLTGKITDDSKYKLTDWSTICFLATVMTEKMSNMYDELRTVRKSYPSIVPIVGQEWNIMLGTAVMLHSDTFNTILDGVREQNPTVSVELIKDYLKDRVKLENFVFIQGGSGSGKTSVVAKFIAEIIKKRNPNAEIITAGPETTQAANISNSLQSTTSYTFSDLMNKIHPGWEKLNRFKRDTGHPRLLDEENEPIVIGTKSDALFTTTSDTKVLVLDEATFLSEREFQILNKWAKHNNVKIIALGDRKQNGKLEQEGKKNIYSGIEDCIYISGPELTESLRNNNVAKANNLRDLTITINKVLDKMRDNPAMTAAEVETEIARVRKVATTLAYYDGEDSFVGERFVSKDQITHYIDKFVNLSTELRKDLENEEDKKPSVLLITEDVDKYALVASKGVTVLTPTQAQGGEYDYVIIDKDFSKNPSNWTALRDFYTAISRSRHGSVIIGNEKFQSDLNITSHEENKSIVDVPLSVMDSADNLRRWKDDILSDILTAEETSEESELESESKKDDVSNDEESETEEDNDDSEDDEEKEEEGEEEGEEGEEGEDEESGTVSPPEPEPSPIPESKPEPIDATFDDGSKPTILTKPTSRDANDDKVIKATVKKANNVVGKVINKAIKGKQVVDRITFLERLSRDNDGSYEKQQMIDFARLFSSAVMFNLDIRERHIKKMISIINPTDTGIITETEIRHAVSQWNMQPRTFEAEFLPDENESVIYYTYQYDGETKRIPISYVNDVVNGTLTVDKYKSPFKQVTIPIRIEAKNGQVLLDRALTFGSTYSSSRIFAPVENVSPKPGTDVSAKKRNEHFRKGDPDKNNGNSGKTFTLWSECDLFTDEDFEEMFKYKTSEDGKFEEYLNGRALEDGVGNYVYQTENGISQAMLINIHRSCNLSELYDMVCIARYACGRIQYTDLTAAQQEKLGKIHDRTRAIKYMKGILGNFGYNLLDETDEDVKKSQLATSLNDLKYKYRLLTAGYQSKILGELFVAFEELSKINPSWNSGFIENVFLSLQHVPVTNRSKTKVYQNCLQITNSNGKKYLAKYRQDGFYDIYEYANYKIGKKVGEVSAKGGDLKFIEIINKTEPSLDSKEKVMNAIRNKEVSLLIIKETHDYNSGKNYYDLADDYDYVYSLINDIPGLDLSMLDEQLAKSQQFAYGFYINDIGREYQVGEQRGTNDSQQTAWRVNDAETSIPLISQMVKVEPSRFEIIGEFREDSPEPEIDSESDSRESFENVSIISEVEKKLLSLCSDGAIDVDPEELEDLIEKHKNNGVDESEIINNIINELSERVGIEITWDFSSNEPIFGKNISKDPVERSIADLQARLGLNRIDIILEEYSIPGDTAKRWTLSVRGGDTMFLYKKDVGSEEVQELDISTYYVIWNKVIFPTAVTKFTDLTWTNYIEDIENDDDYDTMYSLWRLLKTKEKLINCK